MILVADSGSTKCDWLLENPGSEPLSFSTIGFNPMFHNADFIATEILKNDGIVRIADSVTQIFYYGASVSSPDRVETIKSALHRVFPLADISAEHDLTGAVRATCGTKSGIVCILGTGSNSCYFDGITIDDHIPALGYILGDEAGGADFGRRFLQMYLYHKLSPVIVTAIEDSGVSKEDIFRHVYREPGANVYLASFMRLIHKFRAYVEIREMLRTGFKDFLDIHVCGYDMYKEVPVHFVGSVGVNFKEELMDVCRSMNIKTGLFTNEPVKNLFHYHTKKHAEL